MHAKRKRHYEQFQSALFYLKKNFIFKIIFVIERLINHNAHRRHHVVIILKHHDKKLSKF